VPEKFRLVYRAELGSMKVTEQIDAMEVAAINPFKYLVVTRILATTLMVPLLVIFADGVGMLGGFIGINMTSVFSLHLKGFRFFGIHRHHPATIKTFFFGFLLE
jgi:phospholipid/cholesterol/gamma-HCH transport system permease protein